MFGQYTNCRHGYDDAGDERGDVGSSEDRGKVSEWEGGAFEC